MLNYNKSNSINLNRSLNNFKQNYNNKQNNRLSSILLKILKYRKIKINQRLILSKKNILYKNEKDLKIIKVKR